ncbi:MAG: hypothetical protein JNN05_08015, partial [Candidatus Omnitrophica bacterium]|nr:hypothetical protein [Candidatus Omnitrophota bacterium]
ISLTRVLDSKPRFEDWKYIVISLGILAGMALMYRVSVFVMTEFLGQIERVSTARNYKDDQGRFSVQVPAGFIVDPEYARGNALVFNHQNGQQLISVFVMDLSQEQAFSSDQLEMVAVSFWVAKLKIDTLKILASHALKNTKIAGYAVAMYSYDSTAGKNVSVCLLNGQQFYEINFLFKDGLIDQSLVDEFVGHLHFLNTTL